MSQLPHGEVVVRPGTPDDQPVLARLPGLSASTRRGLARDLARATDEPDGDTVVLVAATPAGVVIGAALGLLQFDDGHVLDLAVEPTARRSGTGRTLLSALSAELRSRGAQDLTLEVRASNLGALALYRGAGFGVEGRRPRYYPDGEDALLLWQHAPGGTRVGRVYRDRPRDPASDTASDPTSDPTSDPASDTLSDIVTGGG